MPQVIETKSYRFGRFLLDGRSGCLRRDGLAIPLRPKSFDVLSYLVRKSGRLVPKAELIEEVWRGVAVTDNSLVQCIKDVRDAIGDQTQTVVKTVSKRGYLFTSAVAEADAESRALDPKDETEHGLPLPDRPSIALLPFDNLSGDPDQDYLADGISEDLLTALSRIRWLFVIARNSSFAYRRRAVDIRRVARELGVRYVLEGSVRRVDKRLRISAQLIDATTGGHHWAEQYDSDLGDLFTVQDEITRNVVAAIEPQLLAAEGVRALSHPARDLGAWEMVARAQTQIWRLTREDYEAAIAALSRTVELYPDYAPARSLLAFRMLFAAHMGWMDRDRALSVGLAHATRAVALDDRDPWAHLALGYLAMMERRTEDAIAAFRRAVELNPNAAAARGALGHCLAFAGRDTEAIARAEEAIRLSPLDPDMALFLGSIAVAHYCAGRFDEAVRYSREILRLRPGFQGAQRMYCASLAQAGRLDEARQFLQRAKQEQPQLTLDWIRTAVPYQTGELMERFLEGMRKAGLS
ncbi:tetratricopeptide repeat protein [Bradyrhizobium sp. CB1650]|uniref:tetratricopeptide repeat protein n=1 Tax=Bradyrhizobium sp. CB1650 TaxID=3039153 RepID=UPI0024350A65|nr:tetratricopeptide repeat protein [Bradyrhizobium sp. CB1650]WGD52059.1 tetratricopeptide repeat protein [Bradyrhizobium sp. CB1650]